MNLPSKVLFDLYERDFESAYPELRRAAESDDPDACYYLGKMYLHGDYVQQSDNYAFSLIKRSAAQGGRQAQTLISSLYLSGRGCKVSNRKAILFLTKAARQGCPDAAIKLAELYKNGSIVKRNYKIALYWLRSNKPIKSIFVRTLLQEHISPYEEQRESKRFVMAMGLYLSYLYWRIIKPIFGKR